MKLIKGTTEEASHVRNQLIAFNSAHVPNGRYEEVNLCVKNDQGDIIAGLNSAVCWNWMEIDIIWVDEHHRGEGLGSRLLTEAERIAREHHCSFIKLNTFSFQAPDFYRKYGYEVIAIIEDAPSGHQHYFLKKQLND
ncbi:GNAT family N-acetyltransferase [Paenibacillus sp. PR3]|uniref:GNAT family N-acetyltransferase n=1 Tax=Paenibacillus terricola TaxID=2763503 RepID=A0ABR8MVK8_9BACL|nr:GNAT family N-acetyltransferase [Paenibacillus terricola]MBD3919291.1 GNAT family N-acetyltransferase [Paenibacillus terricola]